MFEFSSYGETTIKLGSKDIDVTTLQTMLKAKGFFDEPVTGTFGMTTKSAVMNFQRAKGLIVDGIVGTQTWAALKGISQSEAIQQITSRHGEGLIPEYIEVFNTKIPTLYLFLGVGFLTGAIIYKRIKNKEE
jgi:hypothetical protein